MAYKPKYGKKKRAKGGWIFDLTAILFFCLLLLGGGMFLRNRLKSKADQDAFQALQSLVQAQTAPAQTPQESPEAPSQTQQTQPEAQTENPATPYQILYEQNPDFVGWLTVPGTRIDYPVMHTPENIEYYIYRAFDGSDSPSGTPFVGDHGSLEEDRCVIYGHNMADGTMFHDLLEYLEPDFWRENPTFTITTTTEVRTYEIFAAVQTRLLYPEETGLRYYRLEEGIESWLTQKSLYNTGITAQPGDSIVILSTCAYHTENGRFLIAGKLRESA